jgi:hypothetical protein
MQSGAKLLRAVVTSGTGLRACLRRATRTEPVAAEEILEGFRQLAKQKAAQKAPDEAA